MTVEGAHNAVYVAEPDGDKLGQGGVQCTV